MTIDKSNVDKRLVRRIISINIPVSENILNIYINI